ncbi:MAG: hypothetical protein ICV77_06185, partial [Cyanobacteria bacterium Co-bin8]|nr:hypothetical protein [Cyanobacteria bacterium Co-bin8]
GQLVLVDFGAAREMTETYLAHLGASGITTVSSAGYTPPEQEQGQAVPQSDFYALGRTMIYLLTAKNPSDPTIYDSRTNALNWRIYAPQISQGFAHLIDDLIAPRAIDRPQTTEEVLQRLMAVRSAQSQPPPIMVEPVTVPEMPSWPTTTLGNSSEATQPQTTTQIEQPLQKRWIWSGVAILALLIGVPAVWSGVLRSRDTTPSASQPAPVQTVSLARTLGEHTGPIKALLLVNGNTLISGGVDRKILIWNLNQETPARILEGHKSVINTLALSTDQQTLYSAGADQDILIWDIASGQLKQTLPSAHDSPINALAISPDGKILASGSADGMVKLWDAETGELIEQLREQGPLVNTLLFNRNGESLIAGGAALETWNLQTQEETEFQASQNFVNSLATSPDNQVLISASADKTVRFWDLATGDLVDTVTAHDRSVNDVVVSSNSLTFVTASADGTLVVWDMDSRQPIERLQGFDSDIYRYVEGPSQQVITTGGTDNTVKVWQKSSP